jgi:hypothetical protein
MVLITMPALEINMMMFKFVNLQTHVGPMGLLKGPLLGWEDQ